MILVSGFASANMDICNKDLRESNKYVEKAVAMFSVDHVRGAEYYNKGLLKTIDAKYSCPDSFTVRLNAEIKIMKKNIKKYQNKVRGLK